MIFQFFIAHDRCSYINFKQTKLKLQYLIINLVISKLYTISVSLRYTIFLFKKKFYINVITNYLMFLDFRRKEICKT